MKTVDREALAAGTVAVTVKAKGKAAKRLRERGKAKVKPAITYTGTGLLPTTQTAKVTLKRKQRR